MIIREISVKCLTTNTLLECAIKFSSEEDLKEFSKLKFQVASRLFTPSYSRDENVLVYHRNQQFCIELKDFLKQIKQVDNVDNELVTNAISQYEFAREELFSERVVSLHQLCKGWKITNESGYKSIIAVNPAQNPQVVSVKLEERLLRVPDMSWSEYCDFERAEYGTFCLITFSSPALAEVHCKEFLEHRSDVKLIAPNSVTVSHGSRLCLHNFREEISRSLEGYELPEDYESTTESGISTQAQTTTRFFSPNASQSANAYTGSGLAFC